MKVEVTLRNGRKIMVRPALAKVLRNRMLTSEESYSTANLEQGPAADELDSLTAEHLHALAKERGVTVHHRAGADRVRAALRGG